MGWDEWCALNEGGFIREKKAHVAHPHKFAVCHRAAVAWHASHHLRLPTGRRACHPPPGPPQNGTPQYMAPEMHAGQQYTFAADVWSLGCLVHELCMLHPTFTDRDEAVVAKKVRAALASCRLCCMHLYSALEAS